MKKQLSKSPVAPRTVLVQNWQPINVFEIKYHPTQPLWQPWRYAICINLLPRLQLADNLPFRSLCNAHAKLMLSPDCSQPQTEYGWDSREGLRLASLVLLTGSPCSGLPINPTRLSKNFTKVWGSSTILLPAIHRCQDLDCSGKAQPAYLNSPLIFLGCFQLQISLTATSVLLQLNWHSLQMLIDYYHS